MRNLKYMAKFAATYPDREFVQTVSAQIPWSHNVAILDKVKTKEQREWYIRKTAENGRVFYVMFIDWEDIHIHYSDINSRMPLQSCRRLYQLGD